MKIHVEDIIQFPRDLVFETYRDKLDELATYLPNIDKIVISSREELPNGSIKLLNVWKAAASEIPSVIRPFVSPEKIQWNDYATWDQSDYSCVWRNELNIFTDQVSVGGRNTFVEHGENATKIIISGDLIVDAKKLPGVPRFMAGKIASTIEKFVVTTIKPNLTNVNRGLEKYLQDQAKSST